MKTVQKYFPNWKWLLGILVPILASFIAWRVGDALAAKDFSDIKDKVICHEKALKEHELRMNGHDVIIGKQETLNAERSKWENRIEGKIDKLLMRRN